MFAALVFFAALLCVTSVHFCGCEIATIGAVVTPGAMPMDVWVGGVGLVDLLTYMVNTTSFAAFLAVSTVAMATWRATRSFLLDSNAFPLCKFITFVNSTAGCGVTGLTLLGSLDDEGKLEGKFDGIVGSV